MAKTLTQIQKEISRLQKEAETLRQREVAGVVARIQEAIAHYGLTAEALFSKSATKPSRKRAASPGANAASATKAAKPAKKPAAPPKYRHESGRTWSGHGKRPDWFKAAIAEGKSADDLLIKP